jgi:hypothetical protein
MPVSMVLPIFKDNSLQTQFDKQGFVVVPFLDASDIALLNQVFDDLHPTLTGQGGFVSGSYSNDFGYKKRASDSITKVFSRHYERLFKNYQTFGAAFLYKVPSQGSELGAHQDWTIVDEERYVALNCWVPLTDINETNGALHVLPGSHYPKYSSLRAPTIPFFFTGNEGEVIKRTIPFYLKAGEAVILNQSVIHYSPPNSSDKIRKAITAGIKSKGAPMLFHYKTADGNLEKFEMPEDFLIRFENFATSIFEPPVLGRRISSAAFGSPVVSGETLPQLLNRLKTEAGFASKPASFFNRLLSRLKAA